MRDQHQLRLNLARYYGERAAASLNQLRRLGWVMSGAGLDACAEHAIQMAVKAAHYARRSQPTYLEDRQ